MSADLFAAFGSLEEQNEKPRGLGHFERSKSTWTKDESILVDLTEPGPVDKVPSSEQQQNLFRDDGQVSVLFDASVEDEDFGNFEQVVEEPENLLREVPDVKAHSTNTSNNFNASKNHQEIARSQVDLLDLDNYEVERTHASKQQSPSATAHRLLRSAHPIKLTHDQDDDWEGFGDFEKNQSAVASRIVPNEPQGQTDMTNQESDNTEDNWEPFEDVSVDQAEQSSAMVKPGDRHALEVSAVPIPRTSLSTEDSIRPTNIPPPVILLQVLPSIYQMIRNEFSGKEAAKTFDVAEIVLVFTVSARLIAGRTLRWKRDQILAQSMRIGPASGKSSGMKLKSVDKNENLKEEQQEAEAISAWSKHAHAFNSALAKAGVHRPLMTLSSRTTAKPAAAGAVRANHACALCGIKRDERVASVDSDVEDSFGEFWSENWGHTACKQFWQKYKTLLDQR